MNHEVHKFKRWWCATGLHWAISETQPNGCTHENCINDDTPMHEIDNSARRKKVEGYFQW